MVPSPGESGRDWWSNTGHAEALSAQNLPDDSTETLFIHDVPADVLAASEPPRDQTSTLFEEPWPLDAWPDIRTRFLRCSDDRFFPREWLRSVVHRRLGIEPIEIPGGHAAYLSQPRAVAEALINYVESLESLESLEGLIGPTGFANGQGQMFPDAPMGQKHR